MKFELDAYQRNISENELLNDIKRVAAFLNKDSVSSSEYDKHGKYGKTTIRRRFDTWNNALKKADLNIGLILNISNEELFKNIENVWITLGRQPKYDEIKKPYSKYSVSTYENRFGSWRKALEAFIIYINQEIDEVNVVVEKNENKNVEVEKIKKRTKHDISERLRFKILLRDGFTCKKCGRSPLKKDDVELHVDHIIPWSKGGETIPDNLETKCKECNLGKGNAFYV